MTQNDLVVNHIPLVHKLAKNLNAPNQREDLIGVGMVALVKTAAKYGPSYGVAFSAYAKRWIRKAMIKYLKRNTSNTVSLDDRNSDGVPYHNNIGSDGQADRIALRDALQYHLHPVEEWVVTKRYFEKTTIEDMASELGFQVSRVSQIHNNALNKLRKAFATTEADTPEEGDSRDSRSALLQVVHKMIWDEWGMEVCEG